jgi:hypothetical protein
MSSGLYLAEIVERKRSKVCGQAARDQMSPSSSSEGRGKRKEGLARQRELLEAREAG